MMVDSWRGRAGVAGAVIVLGAALLPSPAADPVVSGGGAPGAVHGPAGACTVAGADRDDPAMEQVVLDADSGRHEFVVSHPSSVAVLVGDSQADGAAGVPGSQTWPRLALAAAGYTVVFRGRAGTGYATGNGHDPDYVTALRQERWLLPHGDVGLVVIEGGGNDARTGVPDADIAAAHVELVAELRRSYPRSPFVVIGTLARSADDGGGRRHQVDELLGQTATAQGVSFISAGDWLTTHALAGHLADQVHLDARGHRLAARVLLRNLEDMGLDRQATAGASRAVAHRRGR